MEIKKLMFLCEKLNKKQFHWVRNYNQEQLIVFNMQRMLEKLQSSYEKILLNIVLLLLSQLEFWYIRAENLW